MKPFRHNITALMLVFWVLFLSFKHGIASGPGWTAPANMQYNMQVVARLVLDGGTYSLNSNDIVAAFSGDEVRGVGSPLPGADGRIFLTVASNITSGETISFKAWISSSSQIVQLNETLVFSDQGQVGNWQTPFLLTIAPLPIAYVIVATSSAGGSIAPSGQISVLQGGSQTFSFQASAGHQLTDVLVDGQSVGTPTNYTFSNVVQNHSIHAVFNPIVYQIIATAGPGGTINPSGGVSVNHGAGLSFSIQPSAGHFIDQVLVNGQSVGSPASYTFVNVTANQTIHATFVPQLFTLSYFAGPNGSISGQSAQSVAYGQNGNPVLAVPDAGYAFLQWSDGRTDNPRLDVAVTSNISVTAIFTSLNQPPGWEPPANMQYNMQIVGRLLLPEGTYSTISQDIVAAFVGNEVRGLASPLSGQDGRIFLTILSNQSQGESISFKAWLQSTATIVELNESLTFVNQSQIGTWNEPFLFTFGSTPPQFAITASAGIGGSINPSGVVTVTQGGSQTFSITPNAGFSIADVLVNGQSVGAVSSYTFTNVQANQSIHAEFSQITFTITATAGAGGSISPSGQVTVPQGGSQTFSITPNAGFSIANVLVNGQSVGAVSSYTFTNVQTNQSIHAEFAQITYTITATAGAGGSISPSGQVAVPQGGSQTFSITPNAGFSIANVLVNGQSVGAVSSYTFTNVQANQSIHAEFSQITFTITATAGTGGSISPSGQVAVPQGGSQTFSITPNSGFFIANVLVNGQSVGAVSSYTFTNVHANQSIHAEFSQITLTITATAGAGGNISPSGQVVVPQGGSQTFSITPNAGYSIADVLVNGQSVGAVSSYTFTNVQANQSIHAEFSQITFTITATAGAGGSISPSGQVAVPQGGSQTFSITPNAGYFIANVLVNGQSVGAVSSYTFTNVQANQTIHAEFSQITFTITATAGAGGSISPSGQVAVPQGGSQTFSITPNAGFFISDVLVNGQSVGAVSSYTFTNVQANQTIQAEFSQITFTITATSGTGGSISPSGQVIVPQGGNQTFSITPNAGYFIANVLVNGQSVGAVSSYTFTNVQANQSIHAEFSQITFTITATAGAGGSISPSGQVAVPQGGSQTFSITPNAGYFIANVLVNGQSVGTVSSYTFTNVQANQSIHAEFSQITFTINATAGAGGSISPSGQVTVPQGGSQTFSITPNAGYFIADVLVNGQSVGTVSSYTFTNVQANQTIHAEFSQITFTITATSGTGGSISPSGQVIVPQGGNQTFSITPNAGYFIADVLVNGQSVGTVSSYTFTDVQANQSIHAEFSQITFTITATAGAGGSISPAGQVTVPQGGSQTFSITPNAGYFIEDVLVNGQSVGALSSYTFTNVQANQSIHAEFSQITLTITATAGTGGSISPSGQVIVPQGGNQTFSITPNAGYFIADVLVNGQSVGTVSSYTFTDVQANQIIHAEFSQITFTITATAGAGGSISPAGQVTVPYLGTQEFTINPNPGYIIAAVLVNGVNVGATSLYVFTNVLSNQQIHAVFMPATYTITAMAGPGGSISPSGTFTVNHGSNVSFSIQPDFGYRIDSLMVNGVNMGAPETYLLQNISSNHLLEAYFSLVTGIEQNNYGLFLEIYPNPTNGLLNIVSDIPHTSNWFLIDALGRTILQGKIEGKKHHQLHLPVKSGRYQLIIGDNKGDRFSIPLIIW
ncbi:MAG: hypothetical protein IPM52_04575 [Bacteroidetes bacterium]|nr:hypothetical protein [Bacteroidota bacterium]